MPTPGSVGEVYEVTFECRQEGQQVLNILFFRCDTAVDDLEQRMLRALIECFLTHIIPVAASTLQFVKASAKRVTPDLGPIFEVVPLEADTVQGEAVGDALPTYASVCAVIRTTRGGRSGLGRTFLGGVPEGASQGSFIPPANAYWLAIIAYFACVAGKFIHGGDLPGDNQVSLGVMSRKIGGVKAPFLAAGFAAATSFKPLNRLSHNVSRRVGRGS